LIINIILRYLEKTKLGLNLNTSQQQQQSTSQSHSSFQGTELRRRPANSTIAAENQE
jgi:hypothetical protein